MNIGIYGGTFDPPHLGHMAAARASIDELKLDKLIFIPNKIPPHKQLPKDSATPQQRLEMVSLMADGLLRPEITQVSTVELEREGASYTADTLEDMKQRYPDDQLWLLMGTDMFFTLEKWHDPKRIAELARIAVFARAQEDQLADIEAQARKLREEYGAQVLILHLPEILPISSTAIRREKTGEGLWKPVWGYILRNKLYGVDRPLTALDDDDLRAVSWSMIRAKRIAHVQGTEAEAVKLAKRWGANERYARRAAILHDCTKYLDLDEQLQLCEQYGIELDELEKKSVKLLHSKTGSALARYMFQEPEEECQAIYWHTTGRANMTLLEKILYIADYMEPTRDFEGVDRLRELAYTNLDAAVLLGTEMSVEELQERGVPVHSNTIAARDFLKGTEYEHQ